MRPPPPAVASQRSPHSAHKPSRPQTGMIAGVFARLLHSHLPGGLEQSAAGAPPFWGGINILVTKCTLKIRQQTSFLLLLKTRRELPS